MDEKGVQKLLENHLHLKEYIDSIKQKIDMPVFYSKLPMELKDEEYPNIIYPTKGSVFVHIYRTKDMEEIEYHVIEPMLKDKEKEKRDQILKLIVKKAPEKKSVVTDEELKEVLKELIDEIVIVDEKANTRMTKKGFLGKLRDSDKVRVTPSEKNNIEYDIIKTIIGGGPIECFMRDPYLEDIHIVTGENIHLIHKIFDMIKTNVVIDKEYSPIFS